MFQGSDRETFGVLTQGALQVPLHYGRLPGFRTLVPGEACSLTCWPQQTRCHSRVSHHLPRMLNGPGTQSVT